MDIVSATAWILCPNVNFDCRLFSLLYRDNCITSWLASFLIDHSAVHVHPEFDTLGSLEKNFTLRASVL
jgi:hypothetical protein